jgi:hypothetical protein
LPSAYIHIGDTVGDFHASKIAVVAFGYANYGFGNVPRLKISLNSFCNLLKFYFKIANLS